jgi:hypothetical protein
MSSSFFPRKAGSLSYALILAGRLCRGGREALRSRFANFANLLSAVASCAVSRLRMQRLVNRLAARNRAGLLGGREIGADKVLVNLC